MQWYKSDNLDCSFQTSGSQYLKKETLKLSLLAASSACLLALEVSACGSSKEEIALAKAESSTVQACEDSEAAIKLSRQVYDEGLNNVISLKVELLDNI